MKPIKRVFANCIGSFSIFVAAAAWSHDHHDHSQVTGVVRERMDAMAEMGKRIKAISKRVRANEPLASVTADARIVRDMASRMIPMFPEGSTQPPTEATPAIWRNFDDFKRKAKALEDAAAKLSDMKMSDAPALTKQAAAVVEACSNCHEKYRIKQ